MSLIGLSFCRPLFIIAAYSMIGLGSMTLHHLCCTRVRDPCHHTSYFIRIIYYNANSVTCSDITQPKLYNWIMILYIDILSTTLLSVTSSVTSREINEFPWLIIIKYSKAITIQQIEYSSIIFLHYDNKFWLGNIKLLRQLEYYSRVIVSFIIIFVGNSLKKD